MTWITEHIASMEAAGDFYIPRSGSSSTGGKVAKKENEPRVVKTEKYDYPRLQKFFDWEQFLEYIDWKGHENRRASQAQSTIRHNMTLTWSFDEALNLAKSGWFEGLKQLKEMHILDLPLKEELQQHYEIQSKYDVAGSSVNIGRYLSGLPDCMRRINTLVAHALPARIQKVIIVGTFHRKVPVADVLKRGYTVYQIIDALEMANIQTEITIAFASNKLNMQAEDDYDFYETYIKIKDTTDIIYPEKLLFCLAHPSMLRRLVFSEWERNKWNIREKFLFYSYSADHHGYGNCIPSWLPPSPLIKDALVIPYIENTDSMKDVIKKVKDLIAMQYQQVR